MFIVRVRGKMMFRLAFRRRQSWNIRGYYRRIYLERTKKATKYLIDIVDGNRTEIRTWYLPANLLTTHPDIIGNGKSKHVPVLN
jgi:hypothetical protein